MRHKLDDLRSDARDRMQTVANDQTASIGALRGMLGIAGIAAVLVVLLGSALVLLPITRNLVAARAAAEARLAAPP